MGRSWGDLGASLGDLGASGGDFGTSGGGLGASGSGLLGACWHKMIFDRFWDRFWTDLEAQRGPQRSSKWTPNGPKSRTKINIKYEGFQVPLGSVLGLSWVVLGSILGSKIMIFIGFIRFS